MRRACAAALLAMLLAGCGDPVFVPEAGPGAPGYTERDSNAPPPPAVEVLDEAPGKPLSPAGAIDNVVRNDDGFEVTGWARLDPEEPRGVLQLVLPAGVEGEVADVESVSRPDVVAATGSEALVWAGFVLSVRGELPRQARICIISRSKQGKFRLAGSDETLCPA